MTRLDEVRKPTSREKKEHGGEVVFIRKDDQRKVVYKIFASKCYEGWEQWGADRDILGDNVDDVERWRRESDR
jgi:hypothetical protein